MESNVTLFDLNGLEKICKLSKNLIEGKTNFNDFETNLQIQGEKLLQSFISNALMALDEQIYNLPARKKKWKSNGREQKNYLTKVGNVNFSRRSYKNIDTGECAYLLDKLMEFTPHERMSDNVKADTLIEAIETSYRRGGIAACNSNPITKQSTKNLIHKLDFPNKEHTELEPRKVLDTLYIEADEDHAHLQFHESKGDVQKNEKGRKDNGFITKIVYVHEGSRKINETKRNCLTNAKYFTSQPADESNDALWDRVADYISATYDVSKIKNIILQADEGTWIQTFLNKLPNVKYVIDEFHLTKSLNKIANTAFDSKDEVYKILHKYIEEDDLVNFTNAMKVLMDAQTKDSKRKVIAIESEKLIKHWVSACCRLQNRTKLCGCSAEGHVGHYLSRRLSRDPIGWSIKGATNVCKLIEVKLNNECVLDIVKYQKFKKLNEETQEVKSSRKKYKEHITKCKPYTPEQNLRKYYDLAQYRTGPGRTNRSWLDSYLEAI